MKFTRIAGLLFALNSSVLAVPNADADKNDDDREVDYQNGVLLHDAELIPSPDALAQAI